MNYPLRISFCGFGGQGIILSAVVLGTAAVTKADLYAVQTQSYGSEARGGQCQAELIIDKKIIASPITEKKDLLVCMFQDAYNKYIGTLHEDGALVIDPKLVTDPSVKVKTTFAVPATEIALSLGNQMAANMVILGFLCECFGILPIEGLIETVKETVSARFTELNVKAVHAGAAFAKENNMYFSL